MSPCGSVDPGLLAVAKRSPAYRAIRPRIATLYPSDSWYEDELAFVVFVLQPVHQLPTGGIAGRAQAIFVLSPVSRELLAARLVEASATDGEALVRDLLHQDDIRIVGLVSGLVP